jgi:hypothetical protein
MATFKVFYSIDWENKYLVDPMIKNLEDYIKELKWGWEIQNHTPSLGANAIMRNEYLDDDLEYITGWNDEWDYNPNEEYENKKIKRNYKEFDKFTAIVDMENIGTSDIVVVFWPNSIKTVCEISYAISIRKPILVLIDENMMPYQNDFQHIDSKSIYYPLVRFEKWKEANKKPFVLTHKRWIMDSETSLKHSMEVEFLKKTGIDIDYRTYGKGEDELSGDGRMPWPDPLDEIEEEEILF